MIESRKKVYSLLSNYNRSLTKEGFVYTFDIPEKNLASLKVAAFDYINRSLIQNYGKDFKICSARDLNTHIEKILKMPNITPNGKFLPKNGTAIFLNNVQKELIAYLKKIDILKNIDKLQSVNIWIKTHKQSDEFSNRPLYTGKIHSDAWVGHPGDSILWLSPVMSKKNTMEIIEPLNPADDYLSVSDTFEEARERYSGTKLIGKVRYGKMAIMDHMCLHRTYYEEDSFPRITISCGVTMRSEESLEKKSNKAFRKEFDSSYYPVSILKEVGRTLTFSVKETLAECETRFKDKNKKHAILPNNGVTIEPCVRL